ncbi:hypothetical protein Dd1591_3711 [Dickeya chrysanthemi Ech1591]|uniref:Uncharacterized protein n=1 Tax=Dickeya chrysanthemi (strain Ech1591) TaxID=561229 RepID=C6CLL3_DICC1|nr:hypothetical protein Dd1591_3711 [Dickeya chrysanthemi Ech1591]
MKGRHAHCLRGAGTDLLYLEIYLFNKARQKVQKEKIFLLR